MKKVFLFLSAAAVMLVACNKSMDVKTAEAECPAEIAFKSITSNATKGAELSGVVLKNTYGIYAAATQKNAAGVIENPSFFAGTEQLFETAATDPVAPATDDREWKASPAIYWPIGGVKMDYLAYAMPKADHNTIASTAAAAADWTAYWNDALTDVAKTLSFNGVDTYTNQVDMLYAYANGQTSAANAGSGKSVHMAFEHAQALLIFNVKVNDGADGVIKINEIGFYTDERVDEMRADQVAVAGGASPALDALTDNDVTLKTIGTFTVDNSRIDLLAGWSALSSKKENFKMPNFVLEAGVIKAGQAPSAANGSIAEKAGYTLPIAYNANYAQLGETLLIPEQDKVKFTITYEVGGNTFFYTYNDLRGMWEKGKKYIYNLDLTLNEIVLTEEVADFDAVSQTVDL